MIKKFSSNMFIALCTSSALIAFSFYERHDTSRTVSTSALFVAAAVICLLPVLYALVRREICRNKRANG
jgi:hypothetical protein